MVSVKIPAQAELARAPSGFQTIAIGPTNRRPSYNLRTERSTRKSKKTGNAMPFTFNGCGTRFYGERERAEDGSYITTEWITFVYLPLLPIRSYRVLPVGKGTNIIVHSSQNYQTRRVPLCWAQARNVYLVISPIILLVLYFNWSDIQTWVKEDVLKSSSPHSAVQMEPPQAQPVEADLPLTSKDAAVACGKVLKLDEAAFGRLDVINRMFAIVDNSGFTKGEFEWGSRKELQGNAFSAYAAAYLTWDKPTEVSRASLDKMIVDGVNSLDLRNLSSDERAQLDTYTVKYKRMMLKAFDLGRHDAKASPCPF